MAHHVYSRRTDGWFLLQSAYTVGTRNAYRRSVKAFLQWCKDTNLSDDYVQTPSQLDDVLTDYFHHIFEVKDGGGKQSAANTVYGLRMLMPRLKYELLTAEFALKQWRRLRPPESYPPLSWELTTAIAMQMVRRGYARYAVAVLLSFDCLLRISEVVALKREDVKDPCDKNVSADFRYVSINIARAKAGRNQAVDVWNGPVTALLRWVVDYTQPGAPLFPGGVTAYRRVFHSVRDELGLSDRYGPHSLRHGGATALYLRGVSLETILLRGRWKSYASARTYIQTSKGLLMSMEAPTGVAVAGRLISNHLLHYFALAYSQKH
jgi:integrase